jgi:hypothetical protein
MQPENKNVLTFETNNEESFKKKRSNLIYNKKSKKIPVRGND